MKIQTIAIIALLPVFALFSGCAGNGSNIVADSCNIAATTVPDAINLGLLYAESNPTNSAKLEGQISVVAENVETLVASDQFSPAAITAAFHVEDAQLNTILGAIPTGYQVLYNRFGSSPAVTNAIQIVQCIAADVANATSSNAIATVKAKVAADRAEATNAIIKK